MKTQEYNRQVLQEIFSPEEAADMYRMNLERLIEYELERGYNRFEKEQTRSDYLGYKGL